MLLILIGILIIVLYINSFNKRDKNLDYKLTPEYQKSGYDDKLRTDIIKGLEITIKSEIISNYSNREFRTKAIENLIDTREATFYINIESLAQQHKISHDATFDAIFSACNYVRHQFDIPVQTIPVNSTNRKENHIQPSLSDSVGFTKKQKLSCNIFLSGITSTSYITNPSLWKSYATIERKQLELLGLSIEETTEYLPTIQENFPLQKDILKSLNDSQKDFLVSMAIDLLCCNGKPSKEEYAKFEKAFEKVACIDRDEFAERVLKINGLMNN
jgi:hypothetical protein